ncbi:hypothetical protein ACLDYJ_07145 [Acinetobacter baumannii]
MHGVVTNAHKHTGRGMDT